MTQPSRPASLTGFLLAVGSAASFALSGTFASALITGGWTASAATMARIGFSALVLLVPTLLMLRGRWRLVWAARSPVLLFALLGMVGCQLAFFLSVQFIPPSLALLIEFMGPVLLMLWYWARTRIAPSWLTLLGAVIAVTGLVTVSGFVAGGTLHPLGILFALCAAAGNAIYYALGASSSHGIPPLPFVGLSMIIAAIALGIVCALGLLPFAVSTSDVTLAGHTMSPVVVITGLVLIATVLAYVLGVSASRHLGATVASFTGYSEALFGVLWPILLLAMIPTPVQWVGAALIIAGVVTVKVGEVLRSRRG